MTAPSIRRIAHPDALSRLRRFAVSMCAGATAGLLIGGVGGRLAMLLLRLTSTPGLRGLDTDDGFTIGVISGQTVFLLIFSALVGAMGGAVYFLVRPALTERSAPWVAGLLAALVGGAGIIRTDGIDFTLLDPIPLAVALFVAIPAAGGVGTGLLAERWLARERRSLAWFAVVIPFMLAGLQTPLAALATVAAAGLVIALPEPEWRSGRAISPGIVLGGRAVIVAIAVLATFALVKDVTTVL